MKNFPLSLIVVFALLGSVRTDLTDDIQDFIHLIPFDKILAAVNKYMKSDPDVREMVDFIQSDTFKYLFEQVENLPETQQLLDYLKNSGLPMDQYMEDINNWLDSATSDSQESDDSSESQERSTNASNGIVDLTADLTNIFNQFIGDFKDLYDEKMETSPDFAAFINRIESPNFRDLVDAVRSNNVTNSIIDAIFD